MLVPLLAAAVASGGQPSRDAKPVKLGTPFDLATGEAAQVGSTRVTIAFLRVQEDSRCPEGVQCFWEGDAAVELSIEKPDAAPERRVLHTSGRFARETEYDSLIIRLTDVAPRPAEGRRIAPEEYRITLVVVNARSR